MITAFAWLAALPVAGSQRRPAGDRPPLASTVSARRRITAHPLCISPSATADPQPPTAKSLHAMTGMAAGWHQDQHVLVATLVTHITVTISLGTAGPGMDDPVRLTAARYDRTDPGFHAFPLRRSFITLGRTKRVAPINLACYTLMAACAGAVLQR